MSLKVTRSKKKVINVKVYGPLEQVQVHWSAGKADLA